MPDMSRTTLASIVLALLVVCGLANAEKRAIYPPEFKAGAPFSPGLLVDGTLYVSGQVGQDLKTGKIPDNFEDEVRQCFDDIGIILKAGGMGFGDVISVQVYLTDMSLFPRMNKVYVTYFKEPRPTRTTVGVTTLAAPAHMEVTVTARKAR